MSSDPIYMDYNSTAPVRPEALEAMLPCLTHHFGNPASRTHTYGWFAAALVEQARQRLAAAVGAHDDEIVFTSGATEANNLAIKGVAAARPGGRVVTCATEHLAVLDPVSTLARHGYPVTVLPVDRTGRVDPDLLERAMLPDTILVSVMLANNEVGTLQPVAEIARRCSHRGVLVHCDAAQAVGKIPVDVSQLGVDLVSVSAHKLGGPKGIGALVVREPVRRRLVAQIDGGGHEQGLRSGTLNVPGIVGFGKAVELAIAELAEEAVRLAALRDTLRGRILSGLPQVSENGHPAHRLPNTLNLSFAGVDGNALLAGLRGVAVSSGSACSSHTPEPSHVLLAMGRPPELAAASIRFSLGRGSTPDQVETVAERVVEAVTRLRAGSPLWRP